MKGVRAGGAGQFAAPQVVHEALASPGRPLEQGTRAFMESRFGHDFGRVRVHTGERAAASARALGALAYTVGSDIVFGRGQYAPETQKGRHVLAHELAHVGQQRGPAGAQADAAPVVRRMCDPGVEPTGNAINSRNEADYQKAVRDGKYCKDTGNTGAFHEGRCYREVPAEPGFPGGDQVCFDLKTGLCMEDSPDIVSAVEGQNDDGSCNLGGSRSAGHYAEDVLPSEPQLTGAGFGALGGSAIGYAARLGGLRLLGLGTGFVFGMGAGAALGAGISPLARRLGRRGYVPVVGASAGIANPFPNLVAPATWQARLYVGAAKRDRPLLNILYPELRLSVTLIGEQETQTPGGGVVGPSAITSLAAGIRVDPAKPGGHYLSFHGGPALAVSGGRKEVGAEAGLALGYRWRWVGYYANVGYVRDPTREQGAQNQLTLGMGVELGPDRSRAQGGADRPRAPGRRGRSREAALLSRGVVEGIQQALDREVSVEALVPPDMRTRLAKTREAADKAGPDEEASLVEARDLVEEEAAGFMNAHDVAFDLAVLMEKARLGNRPYAKLEFWHFGIAGVMGGDLRKVIVREIERIALLLRKHLPEQAAGVNTILVDFVHEQARTRQEIRLPGWAPPQKGPFD